MAKILSMWWNSFAVVCALLVLGFLALWLLPAA